MALRVTAVVRENGATCDHVLVTGSVEGVEQSFKTSFREIDTFLDGLTTAEKVQQLVMLWAWYRRQRGRAVLNVDIA
jgi:hypothetical protein